MEVVRGKWKAGEEYLLTDAEMEEEEETLVLLWEGICTVEAWKKWGLV